MSFRFDGFSCNRGVYHSVTGSNSPAIHTYSTQDSINMAKSSGYFNEIASSMAINDLIYVHATDESDILRITSLSPVNTVELYP